MPYIYKITHEVNGKAYIGKTMKTIAERWKEHLKDSQNIHQEHRPLYAAMQKYGTDKFSIEEVESCSDVELADRERYWIEYFGTFKYGYNATIGGDGRPYLDYDVLVETYNQVHNLVKTAELCNGDRHHLATILKARGVKIFSHAEVMQQQHSKLVNQYTLQGEYIQTFSSSQLAARSVRPESNNIYGVAGHITDVCRGKRKTAYGYIWRFPSE